MIDLSGKLKFKSDISGNHVTMYPFIFIYPQGEYESLPFTHPDLIGISTVQESIIMQVLGNSYTLPFHLKDYNLKISNIKESLDLKSHSIKISNVTITLNNYEQNGERLSDALSNRINSSVAVYYKTQSCSNILDCLFVYKGIIRRINHDDSVIKLTLEDLTDSTFHKDVPIANMGTSSNCFSKKYLHKYIPMTYGGVDKAPVIPYLDSTGDQGNYFLSIIPDDVDVVTKKYDIEQADARGISISGFGPSESSPEAVALSDSNHPLHIYKGDYFRVLKNYNKSYHYTGSDDIVYGDTEQYKIDSSGDFLFLEKKYSSGFAQNPPAHNELQTVKVHYPTQAEILKTDWEDINLGGTQGAYSSRVINIDTSIYRPNASFDNKDKPSLFLDSSSSNEFDTYSEIPYNEVDSTVPDIVESLEVNGFCTSRTDPSYYGVNYPKADYNEWTCKTNFLQLIAGWTQMNAHWLNQAEGQECVKFVLWPTTDELRTKVGQFLRDEANGYCDHQYCQEGHIFLKSSYEARVVPEYCLNSAHQNSWADRNNVRDAKENISYLTDYFTGEKVHYDRIEWDTTKISTNNEDYSLKWGWEFSSEIDRVYPPHGKHRNTSPPTGIGPFSYGNSDIDEGRLSSDGEEFGDDVYHEYFPNSNYENLAPRVWVYDSHRKQLPSQTLYWYKQYRLYVNNKKILTGGVGQKPCSYPTMAVKFGCHRVGDENGGYGNKYDISHVHVGQWIPETMGSYSDIFDSEHISTAGGIDAGSNYSYIWINVFKDERFPEIPYLYESMDERPVYTPKELLQKKWGEAEDTHGKGRSIATWYGARWNGVEPTSVHSGETTTMTSTESYAKGYGIFGESEYHVLESEMLAGSVNGEFGASWVMYIDNPIDETKTMRKLYQPNSDEDLGEYLFDENNAPEHGTIIPKGCVIPLNHRVNSDIGGNLAGGGVYGLNTGTPINFQLSKESVTVTVGTSDIAERRLGVLFSFSDIESQDAVPGETNTYAYGKLSLFIQPDADDNFTVNNMDGNDRLLVQAYASTLTESDDLNYNAEFVSGTEISEAGEESDYACNLISIDGNDEIFTDGNTNHGNLGEQWESQNGYYDDDKYFIKAWDTPDDFNAISLIYRAVDIDFDGGDTSHQAQISTNIYSMGIIQFSIFEKALNDDLYADVRGRADSEKIDGKFKYTDSIGDGLSLIENPADIMYHMVEKELGKIDVVNRDNWSISRNNAIVPKLAFSVNEKINSKKLIQDIAKNTNLFPYFGSNGEFSFKSLKSTYSEHDLEIKQDDVSSFSFNRTPIEDIVTMVNVKFKKDYATGEYTRQTGYCDAYDFYGNGENGQNIYMYDGTIKKGYDYSIFGLNRESNILEFESDYIRDHTSAESLRNFLMMQFCNQHTIIRCTLPLKYINLEIGDIVKFDKLNNKTKAFGEDYTKLGIRRNNQVIYHYFMITSITKSPKNIQIECIQLHKLQAEFTPGVGSLSRRSEKGLLSMMTWVINITGEEDFSNTNWSALENHFTEEDLEFYNKIVLDDTRYFTSTQKQMADLNGDKSVDQYDFYLANTIMSYILEDI